MPLTKNRKEKKMEKNSEPEDFRDKFILDQLFKNDDNEWLELDRPQAHTPYASSYLRHKAPSRHCDKLSKRHMNFINNNKTNTENSDMFHNEMDVEKIKFVEEVAEMFQEEERLRFEHRNSFMCDGYIYPPKWVVTYYLEHRDDLSKPFLHQMEREMGTSLFSNFNMNPLHGWNKIILDASPFESEIPLAIKYFRKAKIKFKIWPISKKQTEEPESRISIGEWPEFFLD